MSQFHEEGETRSVERRIEKARENLADLERRIAPYIRRRTSTDLRVERNWESSDTNITRVVWRSPS